MRLRPSRFICKAHFGHSLFGFGFSCPHILYRVLLCRPRRNPKLSDENVKLALKNAMRYVPPRLHAEMLPEAARELADHGHIYFHRWRPTNYARENLLQRTFVDKAQHSHELDFHFRAFL